MSSNMLVSRRVTASWIFNLAEGMHVLNRMPWGWELIHPRWLVFIDIGKATADFAGNKETMSRLKNRYQGAWGATESVMGREPVCLGLSSSNLLHLSYSNFPIVCVGFSCLEWMTSQALTEKSQPLSSFDNSVCPAWGNFCCVPKVWLLSWASTWIWRVWIFCYILCCKGTNMGWLTTHVPCHTDRVPSKDLRRTRTFGFLA